MLVFVAVVVGVFVAAYVTLSGPDDSSTQATSDTGQSTTTTTVPKPKGPYRVITGVNIRQGPGTTYPSLGKIELGHTVFVTCVTDGESVDGPTGPSTKWVRLGGFAAGGYLTVQYVDMKTDLQIPGKIPAC